MLVDKLGERLAFERGGVRLYDTLLAKCECAADMLEAGELAQLREFRDEEARHFGMLSEALVELGADPTAHTPCADLVGVESMGLVELATDCGHDALAERFETALTEEARHLAQVRQLVTRLTMKEASIGGGQAVASEADPEG